MQKYNKYIISGISFLGVILSAILLKHHVDLGYKSPLCGLQENNGCNLLNRSDVSEIMGIPLAYLGFLFYGFAALLGLYLDRGKSFLKIIFLLSTIALIVDVGLLFYSIFIAETICTLCAMTYVVTLALFVLTYLEISRSKSGIFPDFNEWETQKVPMRQIFLFIAILVPVSGGFLNYAFSSTGGSATKVKSRGSYEDHLVIAENEYFKAYENSAENHFRVDPMSKKGPIKGIINIVEFGDYLCPRCGSMAEELENFSKRFPDEVSITFRHYPLDQACNPAITQPFHQGSCLLAYASYCALKKNKFWDMHHYFFKNQKKNLRGVSKDDVLNLAAEIGLSRAETAACMDEKETRQAIDMDIQEANELGINGTPTVFIDGRRMDFIDFLAERLVIYKKRKEKSGNGK